MGVAAAAARARAAYCAIACQRALVSAQSIVAARLELGCAQTRRRSRAAALEGAANLLSLRTQRNAPPRPMGQSGGAVRDSPLSRAPGRNYAQSARAVAQRVWPRAPACDVLIGARELSMAAPARGMPTARALQLRKSSWHSSREAGGGVCGAIRRIALLARASDVGARLASEVGTRADRLVA